MQHSAVCYWLLLAALAPASARQIHLGQAKTPLTTEEKAEVGGALSTALQALQGHGGGSKSSSCDALFPDGKAPANPQDPTWLACKDLIYIPKSASLTQAGKGRVITAQGSMAGFYQAGRLPIGGAVHFASGRFAEEPAKEGEEKKPTYEGFEEDWHKEYKHKDGKMAQYPEKSEGLQHHPDYNKPEPKSAASATATPLSAAVVFAALLGLRCF